MSTGLSVKVATSIRSIGKLDWDACANPIQALHVENPNPDIPLAHTLIPIQEKTLTSSESEDNSEVAAPDPQSQSYHPFISYDFLDALEVSGSVGGRSGWTPLHLVVEQAGTVVGVMPAYGKGHSQGEYVFDHGWADAYERAGGRYYPKLQVSIPFTPATGRRLLVRPGADAEAVRAVLIAGAKAAVREIQGSSVHATFLGEAEQSHLVEAGFLPRIDQQFHWINEGYATFDEFLAALASRKRKAIKRERRDALANGIEIEKLTGATIPPEAWDAFFEFYIDTGNRKWGRPYLTRRFFTEVAARMADKILLVMAKREGRYIAGAINFIGSDTLYGRHWGAIEHHPFLHFEVCYHQAIDFAIERRLSRVEAGAQGEHKLARGYRPVTTRSAHWIENASFRDAVARYLAQERVQVAEMHEALEDAAPFRKGDILEPD